MTAAAALLDDRGTYERLDPRQIGRRIAGLPDQARRAWTLGRAWTPPSSFTRPSRVVVLGLGGSAIGADLVAAAVAPRCDVPIEVVRGYAPPILDERALVVACSFSGRTGEVLEAFAAALDRPGMHLALTTGGPLAELADERGAAVLRYADEGPPRTALGFGVFPLLALLERLEAVPAAALDAGTAIAAIEDGAAAWSADVPYASNPAKQLAVALHGRFAFVLGADFLAVAARRWANQISENAKQWSAHTALPEANHNLIAGLAIPGGARELLHVVLLEGAAVHPRVWQQVELTASLLDEAGIPHSTAQAGGEARLDALLRACYLGDWVSYYLAMLNGVDPHPTPELDAVKRALAGG